MAQTKMGRQYNTRYPSTEYKKLDSFVSKIEQNGETSLRRPKHLIEEVKRLMKKKKHVMLDI